MNGTLVSTAAEAILAAQKSRQTAAGIASALDAAGYLQTPGEVRALHTERQQLRDRVTELAAYEVLNPQQCPQGIHADWLVDSEHSHTCPWCRIAELQADEPTACARCGCTDDQACEGGCVWQPNPRGLDLCSSCTTPDGRCTTPACGQIETPSMFGWIRVDVAGSDLPARFHCSPWCAQRAIEEIGSAMAADDQRAALTEKDTRNAAQAPAGESTPALAYLARHEGEPGPMGWYSTPEAARAHCEAFLSAEHPAGTALVWDWIEDDEDGVAELVATVGKSEQPTGYCVIAVELQAAYDPEAEW